MFLNSNLITPVTHASGSGPYHVRFLRRARAGLRENTESHNHGWAGEEELGHARDGLDELGLGGDAVERGWTSRGREIA